MGSLPHSAPGLRSPLSHLHLNLGSPLPHLHLDLGSPLPSSLPVFAGTGLTFATSPPGPGSPRPHLRRDSHRYRCHLCWENDKLLLIGWVDWVKIGYPAARARTHAHHRPFQPAGALRRPPQSARSAVGTQRAGASGVAALAGGEGVPRAVLGIADSATASAQWTDLLQSQAGARQGAAGGGAPQPLRCACLPWRAFVRRFRL